MVSRNLGFRFSLVSYNILSQSLLLDHGHLYSNCNSSDLEWPKRGQKILTELIDNKADIICLQEVENGHLKSLYRPKLARFGYNCLYKRKTGHKVDGCAIFYRTERFDLLASKGIEFKRTDLVDILNRDNVGIIAVLKPKSESKSELPKIVIANTHLIFNPNRCDIRLAQLKLFLSELHAIARQDHSVKGKQTHLPTILCGDFNSLPNSDVVRFLLKNQSSPESTRDTNSVNHSLSISSRLSQTGRSEEYKSDICLSDLDHPFKFKSVYPRYDKLGKPYVSTFSGCIVDYIFYTSRLILESYLDLLTDEELQDVNPIPNSTFPSDHIPLEARFLLKNEGVRNDI